MIKWTQGGVERVLSIRYEITYRRDGVTCAPPEGKARAYLEAARVASMHLEALLEVLRVAEGGGLDYSEGGADPLSQFASLGALLADCVLTNVLEADGVLETAREGARA